MRITKYFSREEKLKAKRLSQTKYRNSLKGIKTKKKYRDAGKERVVHTRWRLKNQEKTIAHRMVRDALKAGKIFRKQCEICGKENAYGHHDDYTKPLELKWFCALHHQEYHRLRR